MCGFAEKEIGEWVKNKRVPVVASRWITSPMFWYGWLKVIRMPQPIVTIFGGKEMHKKDEPYGQAFKCGSLLAIRDFSLLTGGGPGIMEASLCGFQKEKDKKGSALGIGVRGVDDHFHLACDANFVAMPSFAARKWLLIRYSAAFIIFPGGIGTLDELADTLNTIKFSIIPRVPVILIGTHYWKPLVAWYSQGCNQSYIRSDLADVLTITDDVREAVDLIYDTRFKI